MVHVKWHNGGIISFITTRSHCSGKEPMFLDQAQETNRNPAQNGNKSISFVYFFKCTANNSGVCNQRPR